MAGGEPVEGACLAGTEAAVHVAMAREGYSPESYVVIPFRLGGF
jgi:hypothetical protein